VHSRIEFLYISINGQFSCMYRASTRKNAGAVCIFLFQQPHRPDNGCNLVLCHLKWINLLLIVDIVRVVAALSPIQKRYEGNGHFLPHIFTTICISRNFDRIIVTYFSTISSSLCCNVLNVYKSYIFVSLFPVVRSSWIAQHAYA
jgi:hypothetical protein